MNKTVYLAGAMEAAKNLGAGWRSDITPFLNDLNFTVLNPCEFEPLQLKSLHIKRLPKTHFVNGNERSINHWHDLRDSDDKKLYKRFLNYMRRIIAFDIDIVENNTDIVVCYWDESTAQGAGTHSELTAAFLNSIPVYCVTTCPMPGWAKACCDKIFLDFDSLKSYLTKEYK